MKQPTMSTPNNPKSTLSSLSSYQKQQYTVYLQTQLQKFSAFMLAQRKDNENVKMMMERMGQMERGLQGVVERVKGLEYYQRENFRQGERLEGRIGNLEIRAEGKNKENQIGRANRGRYGEDQIQRVMMNVENVNKSMVDVGKRVRSLEQQMLNAVNRQKQQEHVRTNNSEMGSMDTYAPETAINTKRSSKNDIRNLQVKMCGIFEQKFNKLQKMVRKSMKKKEKTTTTNQDSHNSHMMIKDQTFNVQENQVNRYYPKSYMQYQNLSSNPYDIITKAQQKDKSYSISETSQRLTPVTMVHRQVQKKKKKKTAKNSKQSNGPSKSKSKPKSKSKSKSPMQSRSQSRSVSKTKQSTHARVSINNLVLSVKSNELQQGKQSRFSTYTSRNDNKKDNSKCKQKQNKKHDRSVSQSRSVSKSVSRSKSAKSTKSPNPVSPANKNSQKCHLKPMKQYKMNCLKPHK